MGWTTRFAARRVLRPGPETLCSVGEQGVISMEGMQIVGTTPTLPWPFRRWTWLNKPEPAERLAAFRIGVALVLLWDIVFAYWPRAGVFFQRVDRREHAQGADACVQVAAADADAVRNAAAEARDQA